MEWTNFVKCKKTDNKQLSINHRSHISKATELLRGTFLNSSPHKKHCEKPPLHLPKPWGLLYLIITKARKAHAITEDLLFPAAVLAQCTALRPWPSRRPQTIYKPLCLFPATLLGWTLLSRLWIRIFDSFSAQVDKSMLTLRTFVTEYRLYCRSVELRTIHLLSLKESLFSTFICA